MRVATDEGTANLEDNLVLKTILHVPGLTNNLISVSQLIDQLDCSVILTKILCVIQDHISRILINSALDL